MRFKYGQTVTIPEEATLGEALKAIVEALNVAEFGIEAEVMKLAQGGYLVVISDEGKLEEAAIATVTAP